MPHSTSVPGLPRLMADYGLSRRELARRAGVHHQTIYWLLVGKKRPQNDTLWKLARALGLPDTTALTEEGPHG